MVGLMPSEPVTCEGHSESKGPSETKDSVQSMHLMACVTRAQGTTSYAFASPTGQQPATAVPPAPLPARTKTVAGVIRPSLKMQMGLTVVSLLVNCRIVEDMGKLVACVARACVPGAPRVSRNQWTAQRRRPRSTRCFKAVVWVPAHLGHFDIDLCIHVCHLCFWGRGTAMHQGRRMQRWPINMHVCVCILARSQCAGSRVQRAT